MATYLKLLLVFYYATRLSESLSTGAETPSGKPRLILVNPLVEGVLDNITLLFLRSQSSIFIVLKALTPARYDIIEYNRVFFRESYFQGNALVAITCYTINSAYAYSLAKKFRARGATVVMGGPHVTFFPDEALEFCDSVVIGPGEGVWEDLIRDYESGALKKRYQAPGTEEQYEKVYRYLDHQEPGIIGTFLETTRGCKFKCYFCSNPSLLGRPQEHRSISKVIETIKLAKKHSSRIVFINTNIYSNPAYAKELFRAMIPLKVRWSSAASIDIAADDETLSLLKESGCVELLIGYEIYGNSIEKAQGGKFEMSGKYIEFTKRLQKAGIAVKGHFIYGFDSDNWHTFWDLWRFACRLPAFSTMLAFLTPIPGSKFFDDMVREDRLTNLNWKAYDFRTIIFKHPAVPTSLVGNNFCYGIVFFMLTTSSLGRLILLAVAVFTYYAVTTGL